MTFHASYSRTMAGARRIVADEGINIAPRYISGREQIIMLSRRYLERKQRREEKRKQMEEQARLQAQAREAEAERARKLRSKIPQPRVDLFSGTPAREIIAMVAAWHGVSLKDMFGTCRMRPIVEARYDAIVAVYLNCRIAGRQYSLNELGRLFHKDHTTILHALRKRGQL